MKRVAEKRLRASVFSGLNSNSMNLLSIALGKPLDTAGPASEAVIAWLNGYVTIKQWARQGSARENRKDLIARFYKGSVDGIVPVEDHSPASQERIVHLLKVVRGTVASFRANVAVVARSSGPDEFHFMMPVTRLMRQYATYPTFFLHPKSGVLGVAHQAVATNGRPWDLELVVATLDQLASEIPYGEVLAAHGIIELARLGKLDRVRLCRVCPRWFFQGRSDAVTCSPGCRHKIYEQTPAYKERRRDIAKRNYKAKKNGVGAFASPKKKVHRKVFTVSPAGRLS